MKMVATDTTTTDPSANRTHNRDVERIKSVKSLARNGSTFTGHLVWLVGHLEPVYYSSDWELEVVDDKSPMPPSPRAEMDRVARDLDWDGVDHLLDYLKDTLIPDLEESGNDATAGDFRSCVAVIASVAGE